MLHVYNNMCKENNFSLSDHPISFPSKCQSFRMLGVYSQSNKVAVIRASISNIVPFYNPSYIYSDNNSNNNTTKIVPANEVLQLFFGHHH